MEYQGKISGIGNATTRENEITADDLAILRNYINGWEYGIINREGWNFNAYKEGNNVVVEKGIMFAYSYFGILPETIKIPFIKTSAVQYRFIYAEIDRSVIPNTFTIKVKNNQGSHKVKPTTFRQDYLSAVKTGVFQLPLWRVQLDNEGIADIDGLTDLRQELGLLKDCIKQVQCSVATSGRVTNSISEKTNATTQPNTDSSEKLATTNFVYSAIRNYLGFAKLTIVLQQVEGVEVTPSHLTIFPPQVKSFIIKCPENMQLKFGQTIIDNLSLVTEVISIDNGIKTIKLEVDTELVDIDKDTFITIQIKTQ